MNQSLQGESKKPDTFDIQMNNKGVSFFWLTLYIEQKTGFARIILSYVILSVLDVNKISCLQLWEGTDIAL
jgi:hypothetical protein